MPMHVSAPCPQPVPNLIRQPMPRLLLLAGALALVVHLGHDATGFGGHGVDKFFDEWFQPVVFAGSGAAALLRAVQLERRAPWVLLAAGLLSYAAGSVYFNIESDGGATPGFPSAADVMWLALYPLTFAALAVLLRRRFVGVRASVWLDGVIGGTVAAAIVATAAFNPVFDVTGSSAASSVARLAYPVGDLVMVGIVIAVWSVAGRRVERFWILLGTGFLLMAAGDSVYVVEAARGEWAPGGLLDLPYALGIMLIVSSIWAMQPDLRRTRQISSARFALPVICGLTALGLTSFALFLDLNPLATGLAMLTLLAVVVQLGTTLTRLERQRVELAALAATDPLTGLANHRTVHERVARELGRARSIGAPLSVVALDIDHFKAINDTYGHSEGDGTLQAVARVLLEQVREGELVGRVGGEEFALVLRDTTGEEAYAVAERCRGGLATVFVHGVGLACSAGVASYPADDPGGMRLLEFADGALYWAKRSGRAQTRSYDPDQVVLLSSAEQRAQVLAVLDRPDCLTPVFQPIVELATGRVAGYEGLTRFLESEPVRTPDVWFAQARRCGLGPALEARAIEVLLAVGGRPAGTFVSVNVSPSGLLSAEVAAVLPDDLTDIVIELTEDEVFSSDTALDAQIGALRARGARIAIDDAGAGYAGLQQLIRIKPEILKLDRSLITGVDTDASKIALLEALTRFASTTGAAVCGEGIETVEELRTLAHLDTTYAQGYALGRPGPAWPQMQDGVATLTTAEISQGLRLARGTATGDDDAPLNLGAVAERLGQVRTLADLNATVELIQRLLHADEVTVSRVVVRERFVETLSADWSPTDRRFSFDDYPTTEHVITNQVLGQVIVGDPASDPAEVQLLVSQNVGALLMAPIIFRGETVGLLEVYRRVARPWTGSQIDDARLVAHSLAATVQFELDALARWSPPAPPVDAPPR